MEIEEIVDWPVPLEEDEEWKDVDVVKLRGGGGSMQGSERAKKNAVVHIDLDLPKQDVLNVFYDRMKAGEKSKRLWTLSETVIQEINSANYSVWQWRWMCFESLYDNAANESLKNGFMLKELYLIRSVATQNPKNYQLWNHRRKLAFKRGKCFAGEEMNFAAACLQYDAKNYHAWAHRQAVLKQFFDQGLVRREDAYSRECIELDPLNNSAWSQRSFLLKLNTTFKINSSRDSACISHADEVQYTISKIRECPENDAAWEYLKYLTLWEPQTEDDGNYILNIASDMLENHPLCTEAAHALLDYYVSKYSLLRGDTTEAVAEVASSAIMVYNKLLQIDPLGTNRYHATIQRIIRGK